MMQRRLFLQALAASVVAVGAPLPVGFPTEPRRYTVFEVYQYLQSLPVKEFENYIKTGERK